MPCAATARRPGLDDRAKMKARLPGPGLGKGRKGFRYSNLVLVAGLVFKPCDDVSLPLQPVPRLLDPVRWTMAQHLQAIRGIKVQDHAHGRG